MRKRSGSGWLFDGMLSSAAASTIGAAALLGWLLWANRPAPRAAWAVELVVATPAIAYAIMFYKNYRRAGGSEVVTPTLARAKTIVVCALGLLVATMVTFLVLLAVVPDEGSLTPVPRSVYDRARVRQEKGGAVGLMILSLIAIASVSATGERILSRRGTGAGGGGEH